MKPKKSPFVHKNRKKKNELLFPLTFFGLFFAIIAPFLLFFFFEAPPSQSTVLQGGWGFWGDWGKSILSTATATVATVGEYTIQLPCRRPRAVTSSCRPPLRPGADPSHREGRDIAGHPESRRAAASSGRRREGGGSG